MSITTRLILRNRFVHHDGELTAKIKRLYEDCPTLFDLILTRMDRRNLDAVNEDMEFELDVAGGADKFHRRATVIGKISATSHQHFINGQYMHVR